MTNKPGEMAVEIPEVINDPGKKIQYERGRFLGKVIFSLNDLTAKDKKAGLYMHRNIKFVESYVEYVSLEFLISPYFFRWFFRHVCNTYLWNFGYLHFDFLGNST